MSLVYKKRRKKYEKANGTKDNGCFWNKSSLYHSCLFWNYINIRLQKKKKTNPKPSSECQSLMIRAPSHGHISDVLFLSLSTPGLRISPAPPCRLLPSLTHCFQGDWGRKGTNTPRPSAASQAIARLALSVYYSSSPTKGSTRELTVWDLEDEDTGPGLHSH